MSLSADNPYVGPRYFTAEDVVYVDAQNQEKKRLFFGREKEVLRLLPYIIAERLVVFYAQSGAGKSSLIHARLIPELEDRNFIVTLGRVSRSIPDEEQAVRALPDSTNIYLYNLLFSMEQLPAVQEIWEQGESQRQKLEDVSLVAYISELVTAQAKRDAHLAETEVSREDDAPPIINGRRPLAIIIDQFEEIFTAYPWAWKQRDQFFMQLCDAMEHIPNLWIVLALREDHLAALDPYAHYLTDGMRARFYMERMNAKTALEAVTGPAELFGHHFAPGVAETIVECLNRVKIETGPDGQASYMPGQYIEPVQLQVVCYRLWEQIKGKLQPGDAITWEVLGISPADAGLPPENRAGTLADKVFEAYVDRALENFYEESLHLALNTLGQAGTAIDEREARNWVEAYLITKENTRKRFFPSRDGEGQSPQEILFIRLKDQLLINSFNSYPGEEAHGYELIHDRLIEPIKGANFQWEKQHLTPWRQLALDWHTNGEEARLLLLDEKMIKQAEKELAENENLFRDYEKNFIRQSRGQLDALEIKQRRRQITILGIVVVLLFISTIFALTQLNRANVNWGISEANRATAVANQAIADGNRQEAVKQAITAVSARDAATTAQVKEFQQRAAADAARSTAEAALVSESQQRRIAETAQAGEAQQRAAAVFGQQLAQASELSSLGNYFRDRQLDLSLDLSIESVKRSDGWESLKSLFEGLQYGRASQAEVIGSLRPDWCNKLPKTLAYSSDGTLLAVGCDNGKVSILGAQTLAVEYQIPDSSGEGLQITALSFDTNTELLAIGTEGGRFWIWNRGYQSMLEVQDVVNQGGFWTFISGLAFQPESSVLAIITKQIKLNIQSEPQGQVILYDLQQKKILARRQCGLHDCTALTWSQDGQKLAVGNDAGDITTFNKDLDPIGSLIYPGTVTGLAWFADNTRLAAGGYNGLLTWNFGSKSILYQAKSQDYVMTLALSRNGSILLTGTNNSEKPLIAWNAETLKPYEMEINGGHTQSIILVASNPQRDEFVSLGFDNRIVLWTFKPIDPLWHPIDNKVNFQTFSSLDVSDAVGYLFVHRISDYFYEIKEEKAEGSAVRCSFFPALTNSHKLVQYEGQWMLAAGDQHGLIRFCNIHTGEVLARKVQLADQWISALALRGKWLAAAACENGHRQCDLMQIYDLETNQLVMSSRMPGLPEEKGINVIAFSPDGRSVFLGAKNGKVYSYNQQTGEAIPAVTDDPGIGSALEVISLVAGGPKDDILAAGFSDGRIALWEAESLNPIGVFTDQRLGPVTGLAFNPIDGKTELVSITEQGAMFGWQVEISDWINHACAIARRNLTADETARFIHDNQISKSCPQFP